jgi:hypothetical protein
MVPDGEFRYRLLGTPQGERGIAMSTEGKHYSADFEEIKAGSKFWTNDLVVVEIAKVAVMINSYGDTGAIQTWHETTNGNTVDSLSGKLAMYGRLVRFFNYRDAEKHPVGTRFRDI